MALIRAFIAVEIPEGLKAELTEFEAKLKKSSPSVMKWVDPNDIHITLKFLGEISESSIDELILAIEESVQGIEPFKLEVCGVGAFPNMNIVQVVWVGIKDKLDKITQLQKRIELNTEQLGFSGGFRKFTPHLTLGRVRNEANPNERQQLAKLLADTKFAALHNIEVNAVNLMKSKLTPTDAIYTCLSSVKLR